MNTAEMTLEGKRRYDDYVGAYGKEPEIKDVWDAAYYGLISEEEAIDRYHQTIKNFKKMDKIIGWALLPIFTVWFIFSVYVFSIFPSLIVGVQGLFVGVAGIAISLFCIRRSKK